MSARPLCALLAVALLLLALQLGNPWRSRQAAPPVAVVPASAPSATPVLHAQPAGLPSPAGGSAGDIGPCPEEGLPPVVRCGRDQDGLETWWHADGSITKRTVSQIEGVAARAIVRLKPAGGRVRRAEEGDDPIR